MQQIGLAASLTTLPTATTLAGIRGDLPAQYHSLEDPTTQGSRLGGSLSKTYQVPIPSKILKISNIADFKSTCKDENFKNFYSDVWDECNLYGAIELIKIPRMIFVDRSEENSKLD